MINFETHLALTRLYADYALAVDSGQWEQWPEFFTEDGVYKLQPRENHERGFPLATLSFESKGMLKDRAYGIRETLFHDPYYQRHVVGLPRLLRVDDGRFEVEANYAVFRTKLSQINQPYTTSAATSMSSYAPRTASSSRRATASTTAK